MDEQHDQAAGAGSPILHLRCPRDVDPDLYRLLLGLVADVTPVVQALPPSAAVADVSGSVRFFDRDPAELARMIRARALALYGLPVAIGVGRTGRSRRWRPESRGGAVCVRSAPARRRWPRSWIRGRWVSSMASAALRSGR